MTSESSPRDFLRDLVASDLASGKHRTVVTRFPPEPNGYPHIGHAKSICLNFDVAAEFGGVCNLRFDDTNPETEDQEYVDAICEDVRWLGYDWGDRLTFASDYFERLYEWARQLIRAGRAYVCELDEAGIREFRGTAFEPGRPSPWRDRPAEESLELLDRMRRGEVADGAMTLRAKIDMGASNMKMRDPLLYRVRRAEHYRTGTEWSIYPMYDFAHCLEDAIEGVTHSFCTLEFENNREIYDWLLEAVDLPHPRPEQTEFARLNLSYTVLSKRKLLELVREGIVDGWDDPRMPTLRGLRRRGVPPEAIRNLVNKVGVTRVNSVVDIEHLEYEVRDWLNTRAPRVLGVLRPLAVVVTNWDENRIEWLDAPSYPHDVPAEGSRPLPFSRRLWIERDDFRRDPPKKFRRLAPGREVRLRHAWILRCDEVVEDENGEVTELRCSIDPSSLEDARRVPGTIHWVAASHAVPAEVRLYDRLFADPEPDRGKGGPPFTDFLHPASLEVLSDAVLEPSILETGVGAAFQLERHGYFVLDADSTAEHPVLNRTVGLRDTWAKVRDDRDSPTPPSPARRAKAAVGAGGGADATSVRPEDLAPEVREAFEELRSEHGLADHEAQVLAENPARRTLFERSLAVHDDARAVAGWIANDLVREMRERNLAEVPDLGDTVGLLARLVADGTVSSTAAREVFSEMVATREPPEAIVERLGLLQIADDDRLRGLADAAIAAWPDQAAGYRGGRTGLLGFFVGKVMQASGGRAHPARAKEILAERLSDDA